MAKIGRNEICTCGSGLKIKKCCMNNIVENKIATSARKLKEKSLQFSTSLGEKEPIYFENLQGVRKMSEVLIEFAEPLLDKTDGSLEEQKKAFSIAIMAWNLAIAGDIDNEIENLKNILTPKDEAFSNDITMIIKSLVQRKLDLFSDVGRLISDFDIVNTGNGYHLNVVSSLLNGDKDAEVFENEAKKLYGANDFSL